jgi:hypothetical protein
MARLQILELPEGSGDDRPPFVLVVDQYEPVEASPEQFLRHQNLAEQIGARAVLVFEETIDIPANDTTAYLGELEVASSDSRTERADQAEAKLKALIDEATALQKQLDEARSWARHGYEIGQKHCGWTDHGVAPTWLTEGWPTSFDSCEHLKRAAEYDEALSRVRALPDQPQDRDAEYEHPNAYLLGYLNAIREAKRAAQTDQPVPDA